MLSTPPEDPVNQTEQALTTCIHELFLDNAFLDWRKALKAFSSDNWHSLLTSLADYHAPTDGFLAFGEGVFSKLVFNYTSAPDFEASGMLMVQFTVSGSMWHTVVWHCPERN